MQHIDYGYEKFLLDLGEIEKEYLSACEWIDSFGIAYEKTRFGSYEKELAGYFAGKSNELDIERLRSFFNANLEAAELIRLKNTYADLSHLVDPGTLKKITAGQQYRSGSVKDQSRDFAFELGVASRFIKAGYEVKFDTLADVLVNINGISLYVECKRIKSSTQLKKRIKEASKQLSRRLDSHVGNNARGLVAINLTEIVNPQSLPAIASSLHGYRERSMSLLRDYMYSYKEDINSGQRAKCLGVLAEFTTQGFINSDNIKDRSFVSCRESTLYRYRLKESDKKFLDSFWRELGDQNIR